MKNKFKINFSEGLSILLSLYLLFFTIYYINGDTIYFYIGITIGTIITFLVFRSFKRKYALIYIFAMIIVILLLIQMLLSNQKGFSFIPFFIMNIAITIYILENRIPVFIGRLFYYGCVIFFGYHMLIEQTYQNYVLETRSSNYISVLMIIATIIYFLSLYLNQKKISVFPTLITLIISLWAGGRGGIIASAILFLFFILMKVKKKRDLFILSLIFMIIIYYLFTINIQEIFMNIGLEKFYQRDIDSEPRLNIADNYLSYLTVSSAIFGVDMQEWTKFFQTGSLHNSFLQLHALTGIGALIFLVFLIRSLIKYFVQREFLIFILLITITVRAFTDTFLFFNYYDFVFYTLIFYCYYRK